MSIYFFDMFSEHLLCTKLGMVKVGHMLPLPSPVADYP